MLVVLWREMRKLGDEERSARTVFRAAVLIEIPGNNFTVLGAH